MANAAAVAVSVAIGARPCRAGVSASILITPTVTACTADPGNHQ